MHDWYVLRSGGEEDGPGAGDGGSDADCLLQGGIHLRGEYGTEFKSVFSVGVANYIEEKYMYNIIYSLTCKNLKLL